LLLPFSDGLFPCPYYVFSAVGRILKSDISNRVFVEYKYSTYILNLHLFQFRKLGIQLFHALFAEVDGQSGGFAFVYGIDNHAGAEFGVADVLADAEACVGLWLFEVVDDFVPLYGGLACVAVAVGGGLFWGRVGCRRVGRGDWGCPLFFLGVCLRWGF